MPLKKHTKKELINLAPETMLYQHIDKLNLPEHIKVELSEQLVFIPRSKKILMCSWSRWEFEEWYYSE